MKTKIAIFLSFYLLGYTSVSYSMTCDGKITEILSGNGYCSGGERLGFKWSDGSEWLCSSNRNMDALIMMAHSNGKTVSVRDPGWTSCTNIPARTVPDHIWVKEQ